MEPVGSWPWWIYIVRLVQGCPRCWTMSWDFWLRSRAGQRIVDESCLQGAPRISTPAPAGEIPLWYFHQFQAVLSNKVRKAISQHLEYIGLWVVFGTGWIERCLVVRLVLDHRGYLSGLLTWSYGGGCLAIVRCSWRTGSCILCLWFGVCEGSWLVRLVLSSLSWCT